MSKFKISAAPLSASFNGTAAEFIQSVVDRLKVTTDAYPLKVGATPPPGNEGPWFKDGVTPYVWNEETSAYIPLDLSASYLPQIWVGDTEPDVTKFVLWYKLLDTAVVGLFYYTGTEWVSQNLDIADGSITSAELANNSITTVKLRALAVTVDKLAAGIEMIKWVKGNSREFIRMNPTGTSPNWRKVFFKSPLLNFGAPGTFEVFPHGLPEAPFAVQLYAVWTGPGTYHGMSVGDEICLMIYGNQAGNGLVKDATNIKFHHGGGGYTMPDGTDQNVSSSFGFAIRVYYTAA